MEILAVIALIIFNGVFAMSEIAVVTSRPVRLRRLADHGVRGAATALAVHKAPTEFLSTIQIGITLIGVLLGALGEAVLADDIALFLNQYSAVAPYSEQIALGVMVVVVTYFSLVIGELVPKRLALQRAERIACLVAPPMRLLSRVTRPAVRLLSLSVETVLRLLRAKPSAEPSITEEEIHAVIEEGMRAGVLHKTEREVLKNVMRLADRGLVTLMCPRSDIVWLDPDDSPAENRRKIASSPHSRFPVARGGLDQVVGIVQAKDFLAQLLVNGGGMNMNAITRPVLRVSPGTSPLRLLEMLRTSPVHVALVISAGGEVRGLVTLHDILEAMVGDLPAEGEPIEQRIVRREDGSFLLDGLLAVAEFKEVLALALLPDENDYETLAGFAIARLDRIPKVGDHFEWGGWQFEIVDMDGTRIDRVLAMRQKDQSENE